MDKELLDLLNQARQSGANETQLQNVVDSYNLKKKSSSGAPVSSSNGQSTSQSQETNAPSQPDFNFINRKGESTLHVGDDPLGNTITQLQSKKDNLINSGTDATMVAHNKLVNGKNVIATPKEDEINGLDADIQDIKQNAFADPNQAQQYLKQKLVGKPIVAKNDAVGQPQPLSPNTDLLSTDLNSVKQNLNFGNLTDQLAFNRVKKEQDINDALSTSQNITDAAIKYNSAQNPQIQRQVQFLQQHGQQLPDVFEGQMISNFLNDPDVISKTKNDPNFASQYADEQRMLLLQHPEFGKRVVASKISQAREDAGLNNPIVNIPTQESTDKVVADLVQKGQLSPTEQSIYENKIKPSLGVMQSIGRGVGRLIPGVQAAIDESPISTPGFLENAENSYVNTLHGMAHSIEDVGQLGNRLPTTQDAGRLKDIIKNDYSNVVIDPKGAWNSLGQSSGQFTGFVLPMIMGGAATKAVGAGATATELIPQGLVFEGQNKDNALKMFPNDPSEQFMYTTLATAGDLMLGKLLPTGEAKEGVRTLLKDDIKNVVNDFTSGKIDALAARNTILQKATDYVKKVATTNLHTGSAMAGFGLLHNGLDAAFQDSQGGGDVSLAQTANDAIESFKTGFIGGTPLSMFAAIGSDSKLSGKVIREMAQNPDKYAQIINDQTKLNPNLQNANAEKLQNLQDLSAINNDLEQTNLTDRQKEKYLVQALNQKVWERKASNTTDDVIKKDYLNNAAKSAKIKNDIYSGLDKATDHETYNQPTENEIPKPAEEAGTANETVNKNQPTTEIKPNSKDIAPVSDFKTLNMGNDEGKPETKEARAQMKERFLNGNVPIDGEDGKGETGKEFVNRVISKWQDVKDNEPENTTVVTHSSVLKAIKTWEDLKDKEGLTTPSEMTDDQWKAFADRFNKESTDNGDLETFKGTNGNINVIRHGETQDNAEHNFRSAETNLTDKGKQQAVDVANELKDKTDGNVPKIISSDLPRAIHSSNIIDDVLKNKETISSTKTEGQGISDVAIKNTDLKNFNNVFNGNKNNHSELINEQNIELKKEIKKGGGHTFISYNLIINGKHSDFVDDIEGLKESINGHFDSMELGNQKRIDYEKRKKEGAIDFTHKDIKELINNVLPNSEYGTKEKNALSGSDYIIVNGKKIRFSDHSRPAMSKWNFIYGDENNNAPEGQLFKKDLHDFIFNILDGKISEIQKEKIDNFFENKKKQQPQSENKGIGSSIEEKTEPEKVESPPNPPKEEVKNEEPKDENKVGVSQAHLTELAKRLGLKEPERGEYIEPHEYAERGRQLLKAGATLDDVNNTSNELHDRIAIARAHLEDLTEAADKIGKIEGVKSDEYKDAAKKVEDYYLDKVKKLGTLAHRAFVSLQGERDLNTGSFTAVKKAFEANNGSKATDEQTKKIVELTKNVEDLRQQNKDLEDKLIAAIDKDINGEKETETNQKGKFEKQFKGIADKFRKLKSKEFKFKDENGNEVDLTKMGVGWNDLVELGAKAIEATGKVADGVAAIIEKVKDSDFYAKLSNEGKKSFQKQLTEHFENLNKSENKLDDLHEMFSDRRPKDMKFNPDEAKALWNYGKEEYLNKGVSYRDMISYVSHDTGLTFDQVFNAITSPKTRPISDEVWIKQRDLRRAETKTKDFVERANKSTFTKVIEAPDQVMRGTAVYGHGGLFVGTHAGMTLTDLPRAKYTVKAFLNGYKNAYGNDAVYERNMQKLQDRPNYVLAQRAGLQNNPNETNSDQYQKAQKVFGKLGGFFKKIGESGVKGFNAIKVLRQDLFDDHYNRLSAVQKADPESARSIAELVNNATGATNLDLKLRDKKGNVVVNPDKIAFAANMEAARWEKLLKNPIKATGIAIKTILNPSKATAAEKVFAKVWATRVGWELSTYAALAVTNALIQSKTNPKNPVNLTDPTKPDYMKFKVGNTDINMTSGMLGSIDFIAQLAHNSLMSKKQRRGDNVLQADAKSSFQYGRGKLSPFAATIVDLKTGTDYSGNTLPYNKDKPATGKHQLSWGEYGWEKAPIPVADAAKTVHESMMDNGLSKAQTDTYLKGLLAFFEAGTTGFRINDSYQRPTKFTDEDKKDPVLKYWINKVGNLPEVSDANIQLHDTKNQVMTSVAAMPKEKIEQFDAEHKAELKAELSKVNKRGYVYGNSYGDIELQYPESPKFPLKKIFLYQLTDDQSAKVLSKAQSEATKGAKMKVFKEN